MEKKPNLWKFKLDNKNHNSYNKNQSK
jgi:hypothetical protein